jgi:hypothetical protein
VGNEVDRYDLEARFAPAYLALAPAILTAIILMGSGSFALAQRVSALIASLGIPLFLGNVARSRGKREEGRLRKQWGGRHSVDALRFRSSTNQHQTEHRHAVIGQATGLALPTQAEEAADPGDADARYAVAVDSLIAQTRPENGFRLLFLENCNYGFRRNLLGMKKIGLGVGTIVAVAGIVLTGLHFAADPGASPTTGVAVAALGIASLIAWRAVTDDWVEEVARSYAERLMEAADVRAAGPD